MIVSFPCLDRSPLSTPPPTPQPISTFSYARPTLSLSTSHDHGTVPFTPVLRAPAETQLIQPHTPSSQATPAEPTRQTQTQIHMQMEPTDMISIPGSSLDSSLSHVLSSTISVLTVKL